jgi:cytoskeletal protein CcmA (bactofilin family)
VVATASLPTRGGTVRAQIRTTLDRISYPFRWAAFATLPNGILHWDSVLSQDRTDKELWLAASSLVDSFDSGIGPYDEATKANTGGDIGANGDVMVGWDSQINGSIKAGEAIYEGSGVIVKGARVPQAATQEFPVITPDGPPSGDLWVSGGSQSLAAGTYHFLNMFFANDTSLVLTGAPVTIYVSGWVSLGSNVIIGSHPGTNFRLITKSDGQATESAPFQAGDNLRFHGMLYGKNTDVYLGANAQIHGAMIARTIYAGGFAKIHLDQAVSRQEICHNGNFTVRRGTWRQVPS